MRLPLWVEPVVANATAGSLGSSRVGDDHDPIRDKQRRDVRGGRGAVSKVAPKTPCGKYPIAMASCAASGPGMIWARARPGLYSSSSIHWCRLTRSRCMEPTKGTDQPKPIVPSLRK
jgi:hypothetical protein